MSSRRTAGEQVFSYRDFRTVTGLTKKEADTWVKKGLITAPLTDNGHRRTYTQRSLMEGAIAKEIADFSSRELLGPMLESFRDFLKRERIDLAEVSPDYFEKHPQVKVYTRKSQKTVAGGGVRGVVARAGWFDPDERMIGKSVYLVIDLTLIAVEVLNEVIRLN